MLIQMELRKIVISEINEQQLIFLREIGDSQREFAMVVGRFEAISIDRRVKQLTSERPLTHDLIVSTIEAFGGKLESVLIPDLRDRTYYAILRIRKGSETIDIDSRPSDAIAVAMACNPKLPIYVADDVIERSINSKQ